jgi:hypothetical protein
MKKSISIITLLVVFLAACQTGLAAAPTPTLEPAINFEKGISQIPKGYYVFIELRHREECSSECQCAPEAPAQSRYNLTASNELVTDQENIIPALSSPIVGFFGSDRRAKGMLYVIDTLPYQIPPYDWVRFYNVDAQGVVTVELVDKTYFIKPGQSWVDGGDVMHEPPDGCHVTYSTSLSNHGLLPQAQIQFGSVPWSY